MNKVHAPIQTSILCTIILITGCSRVSGPDATGQYIIDVVGAPVVLNCSKSYTYAGHYAYEENDTVSIAVSQGDLIYFQFMDDEILCYRYNAADELNLALRFDPANTGFYLNNELISLSLSEGSAAWEWCAGADENELKGIRSLHIYLPLSENEINSLEKLSGTLSKPGLFVEGDSLLEEVIAIVRPRWLIGEALNYSSVPEDVRNGCENLELLWHSGADPVDYDFLYALPALNSLILEYWDSTDLADIQWDQLKYIESLSIIQSDLYDLSPLALLPGIRNLNIVNCETLREITAIGEHRRLAFLGFTGCQHITNIPAIQEMTSLTRLSVPGNTSQAEFADIMARQETIQVLELIDCESITDLSPLENHTGLRALTVDFNLSDPAQLCRLSGLELLVLGENILEDSLAMAEIRKALPETRIVAGGGFCLGSGWILLLLPAILLCSLVRQRYAGSRPAAGTGP